MRVFSSSDIDLQAMEEGALSGRDDFFPRGTFSAAGEQPRKRPSVAPKVGVAAAVQDRSLRS
jgi:hypothetical protein